MTGKLHILTLALMASLIILPSCSNQSNLPQNYEDKSSSFNLFNMKKETKALNEGVRETIYTWIDSIPLNQYFPESGVGHELTEEFKRFYRTRDYQPAWIIKSHLNSKGIELVEVIKNAEKEGLNPDDYYLPEIEKAHSSPVMGTTPQQIAKLDFLVTSAYLKYADHLMVGRLRPADNDNLWMIYPKQIDLSNHLNEALSSGSIQGSLEELYPKDRQYDLLKEKLSNYKKIRDEGGWEPVITDVPLKKGDKSIAVEELRKRLQAAGLLEDSQVDDPQTFTPELEAAVIKAQQSFGITPNGVVGKSTIEALNIPIEKRIDQIMINMERMRWVPVIESKRLIRVNIPNYYVTVFEDGKEVISMKVIVGKTYHSTPIFIDTMEHVVFSPTWRVPMSIARNEMLPKIKNDPSYLVRNHYSLYNRWTQDAQEINPFQVDWSKITKENFNYRIVQDPGHFNALGLVKFMFPNRFSIYLHDTPSDYLFEREQRSFSHGCIRVEKPAELAEYLLKDSGWDKEKVKEYMGKERPATILLNEKIPVEILYYTAFVDKDGLIHFRNDIYGYDEYQINKMHELNEKKL